jgi:preprotein translocase SecE subunit
MARRQRQRRRRDQSASPAPRPSQPRRGNVPGSLDRASGDAEEFEAGIVAGAGGRAEAFEEDPAEPDELADGELESEAVAAGGAVGSAAPTAHRPAAGRGPGRAVAFLRASWAELQRVQWPDRRQVAQATAVVLGFVVVAGAYLGLADLVAQKVVNFIL